MTADKLSGSCGSIHIQGLHMLNDGPELVGWSATRAVRILFLVEAGRHSDLVLDGIFADCYARWGGRFSLIVPCAGGKIVASYWPWMEFFDPDLVYSYADLDAAVVLEVHERLVPADYVKHHHVDSESPRSSDFRPRHNFAPLSSLSTVFRLGRHSSAVDTPKVKIVDSWYTERTSRFLCDNLGTYHGSATTGIFPNDATTAAGLLTVVSDEYFNDRKYGVPRDLDRVATEDVALAEFAAKRATALCLLSSLYSPRIELPDARWAHAFNLVIGESFEDRLMFWNGRLLVPAWLDGDLTCFRVTLEQLRQGDFAAQLARLLNARNHVGNGAGQPRLQVRSASHDAEELNEAISILRSAKVWNFDGSVEPVPGGHVIPSEVALHRASERVQAYAVSGPMRGADWHAFHWRPPTARPPHREPEHLRDAPFNQAFTLGSWAVDLAFEQEGRAPRFSQVNVRTIPKRWRLASAHKAGFSERGFGPSLPAITRRNAEGNLTVFASVLRVLESIEVPTIDEALRHALCTDAAIWHPAPGDPPWPAEKARWMRPSSESSYLAGILGMTEGLANARRLLLHPFLQDMFAALGATPNLADADVRSTAESLAKRARGRPVFDLQSERERDALAALIVKAAQSIKAPKMHVALEDLRTRWQEHRARYWAERPHPNREQSSVDWDAMQQRAIDDGLAEMRDRRMLFQGYPWTCETCMHRNWTDFQALRSSITCDACQTASALPVGVPWHFRPNEFLLESLRSHSVLSLIWALSALYGRARKSFMYVGPTCFGWASDDAKPDAEADLLLIVDGEAILCEVKSAWRSLRAVHVQDLVRLAMRLRPDRVILAIMESGDKLAEEIKKAEDDLRGESIRFELLTPATYRVADDPYLSTY
ncbi:zinc finger Ran-binding domain-containing protein [Roseateles sp. NT4]|uniref:zinc finger Ran-binding domain-containing protein n=1 Tax=Roseateles sp. NT4 TaxID=3453715 RepID=UPI003EEA22A8